MKKALLFLLLGLLYSCSNTIIDSDDEVSINGNSIAVVKSFRSDGFCEDCFIKLQDFYHFASQDVIEVFNNIIPDSFPQYFGNGPDSRIFEIDNYTQSNGCITPSSTPLDAESWYFRQNIRLKFFIQSAAAAQEVLDFALEWLEDRRIESLPPNGECG